MKMQVKLEQVTQEIMRTVKIKVKLKQMIKRRMPTIEMIKTKMLPFFKEFLGYMQQARVKDSSLVKNLITIAVTPLEILAIVQLQEHQIF